MVNDISGYRHQRISGGKAELSKALVYGTSLFGDVGSNPTASRYLFMLHFHFLLVPHFHTKCHGRRMIFLDISTKATAVAWQSGLRRWFKAPVSSEE
ncbi:hypothetical protein AVEN_87293-1 [Araneus ventricosus]|uniref:Uncharacterized protein n=1 Tax=Araneus ventricosus TaxID=182803 RepID=A0A4Y2EE72_ARAVE|nr:hypothetical protein AVEN_87293-1 [Araneus ventricosus]